MKIRFADPLQWALVRGADGLLHWFPYYGALLTRTTGRAICGMSFANGGAQGDASTCVRCVAHWSATS